MHRGQLRKTFGIGGLLVMLAAGCGGSGSSSTAASSTTPTASVASASTTSSTPTSTTSTSTSTSSTASEKVPTIDLPLASSAKLNPISARYTCDGADTSLPISWSHIPPHTAEIEVFVFNFLPVGGKLFPDWAVAGLKPSLHGLSAGQLPAGAIVGRNGFGQIRYSICPAKGSNTRYAFLVYAVPHRIAVRPGFNANALREKSLHAAEHAGLLAFSYKRH
jgi:phosphatidylethanolamine-binding protein (PEBP) family uncharacterized protein